MPSEEEKLISAGASMIRAASNGDAGAVRAALAEGAYVDQRDQGGHTALIIAAIFNHVDITRLLLSAGAEVRLQDHLGLNAREWANRRGSSEVAQLLLDASRAEAMPPEKARKKSDRKIDADSGNPEAETDITHPRLAPSMTREQSKKKAEAQGREVEEERREATQQRASAKEIKTLREPEPDTVRWMKFHKQIMAAKERREAEEARREAGHAASLSERRTVATESLSEQGSVATESSPEPKAVATGSSSEQKAVATGSSSEQKAVATRSLSEQGAVATGSFLEPKAVVTEPKAVATGSFPEPKAVVTEPKAVATGSLSEQKAVPTESSPEPKALVTGSLSEQKAVPTRSSPEPKAVAIGSLSEQKAVPTRSSPEPKAVATKPKAVATESLSEQRAVATGSLPEQKAVPTGPLSEQGAVATVSSSEQGSPPGGQLGDVDATRSGATSRPAEGARPTPIQLAKIAATIEHLKILEEPRQRLVSKIPAKSEAVAFDRHEFDTTIERLPVVLSLRTAELELKPAMSLDSPPIKRCPKCNASYSDPLLAYCAYDATKLTSDDDPVPSHTPTATDDRFSPTLWALVAVVAVLGAFLGYLITDYRSMEKATTELSKEQIEKPPDTAGNNSPVIEGALSGMEVNVPVPEYPAQARAQGISGTVTVRVQVNQKGRVVLARSSGGDRRLRTAAVAAAQKATFSPEKLVAHGRVVSGTITYNFVAQTGPPAPTGSPAPTQTNSPSATGSSSATGPSAVNASRDHPVVGGALVGAESNLPQPDYPERLKSKGIPGTITILVRVNRAGKVISWRTLEGDTQLRAAALQAARKATFSPEKLPGAGEVLGTITYNFKP